ncbi:hypothetical protein ACFYY3_15980 [Streptomyces sp. NPDC001812]|uniref:hypothetical protein n=1 Tax=Streptomyces sp. NPDC001812 TaxID=3364611 RepID=UPI0036B5ACFD
METPITALEQRVDDLQKKAAGPTAELEQVRAELDAAREAENERQAGRRADWERGLLDSWEDRDAQLQTEERQARADFAAAIAADPVWSAWIRVRASWGRRNALRSTADGARRHHTPQAGEIPLLSYREPTRLWDEILSVVQQEEQEAANEETSLLHTEREQYAKGDS